MVRRIGRFGCVVCYSLILAGLQATADTHAPAKTSGLVAWYRIDSLHKHKRGGDPVERWKDSSRRGHDLKLGGENKPPEFVIQQVNEKPVVSIRAENWFDVSAPFELEDHTIFLVYATENNNLALFRSDTHPHHGVILGQDGESHFYQNGKQGLFRYNHATPLGRDFSITVLGREAGLLRAFVNGVDISSGAAFPTKIRVGRLFQLKHTTFVGSDGQGLRFAEMIFYDRFLTDAERSGITEHLSEKYAIAIESDVIERSLVEIEGDVEVDEEAVLVRLGTSAAPDLNVELAAVGWDSPVTVDAPFRFDPEEADTELHCTRDNTRVRLTLTLPLRSEVSGAQVQALILKNAEQYLPQVAVSGPFEGPDPSSTLRFRATLSLNAGDFFEVVTSRVGAAGPVLLDPAGAVLIVERIE
jgi:hypothetical protein